MRAPGKQIDPEIARLTAENISKFEAVLAQCIPPPGWKFLNSNNHTVFPCATEQPWENLPARYSAFVVGHLADANGEPEVTTYGVAFPDDATPSSVQRLIEEGLVGTKRRHAQASIKYQCYNAADEAEEEPTMGE